MMHGLMVSVLTFRLSGTGSSPSWGHCAVLLSETLKPHGTSLYSDV